MKKQDLEKIIKEFRVLENSSTNNMIIQGCDFESMTEAIYTAINDEEKSILQEFYTIGKTEQIRDKVITGSYAIGSNGMKEPIDWKRYAERLEEYIINIMIKERKI